jgi:gluconate 2-dehydrogenase gamma chain
MLLFQRIPTWDQNPGAVEAHMSDHDQDGQGLGRRDFLKGVVVGGGAAATTATALPQVALAQQPAAQAAGYAYLNLEEQAFVEAVVDHMIPADELTPKGSDIGINTYIDRALAGGWGKGDRLYMQGPWAKGTPNQGYQLPMTPAQLYRAAIPAANAQCRKSYGKEFADCTAEQKEAFLKDLQAGKVTFAGGLSSGAFFTMLYDNVMEGMFADPIYGGNKDKVSWKMLGFPGVLANNAENAKKYNKGQRFPASPVGIQDLS